MKKYLTLAGFVIIGLTATVGLYLLLVFGVLETLRSYSGKSPDLYIVESLLIMLPLSLFLGSTITGYLGSRYIKTKLGFLWIAPGLYFSIVYTIASSYFALTMLLVAVLWILASLSGIGVGHIIRLRKSRGVR